MNSICIKSDNPNIATARLLSDRLDAPLVDCEQRSDHEFTLELKQDSMIVHAPAEMGFKPWILDLGKQHKAAGRDPLARAIGSGVDHVVDATAGWCIDSLHIASLGIKVTAIEQNRVVSALVEHALTKLEDVGLTRRIELLCANSINVLQDMSAEVDVVYLDPMYPQKRKSAVTRKELVILRRLVGPGQHQRTLFDAAMGCAQKRVVVKRPHYADPVAPGKVGETRGKLVRFDIYHPHGGMR